MARKIIPSGVPAGQAHKPGKRLRRTDLQLLARESWEGWIRHKGARLGASLAFYTLFSLAPLLLIAVFIGGFVFGDQAVEDRIVEQITSIIGPLGAGGVHAFLEGTHHTTQGILATMIGLVTLLFGASAVLLELKDALNTIWEVPSASRSRLQSVIGNVKDRIVSFALVLSVGFLMLVSLIVNAFLTAAGTFFARVLPAPELLLQTGDLALSLIVTTALFAAIYKILPDTYLQWTDVWFGAAVTSLLFTLGKFFLGVYLGKASFTSVYGAAASVVILIVWVYYSGQVFFLGAEFTKAFATWYGSKPPSLEAQAASRDKPREAPLRPRIILP
jgi:membrane protein